MFRSLATLAVLLQVGAAAAQTQGVIEQQALPPLPGTPSSPPSEPVPLMPEAAPPPAPAPQQRMLHLQRDPMAAGPAPGTAIGPPAAEPSPGPGVVTAEPESGRVFCDQNVTFRMASRASVPEQYRPFLGIFSDAAWTPQLCAALIVQDVKADGTASIVYAFGPMGANPRSPRGVLNGTGIVRDGELRFQNSDGSQFAFKPLYSDLDGRLTTPQGQSYEAVFKRTF